MISHLRGLLTDKQAPLLVIEINGIGYEIQAPLSTFYQLPEINHEIYLLTHLSIRDDALVLYGFMTTAERQLFRSLIRVNGVGPKLALSILSAMELTTFIQAIQTEDVSRLTKIPGVGKKTAERLIIEMRDRLDKLPSAQPTPAVHLTSPLEDAISVLIALGYKLPEATRLVHQVKQDGLTSEELIRRALQAAW